MRTSLEYDAHLVESLRGVYDIETTTERGAGIALQDLQLPELLARKSSGPRFRLLSLATCIDGFDHRLTARKAVPHRPDEQIDEACRHFAAHQSGRRKLVNHETSATNITRVAIQ